MTQQGFTLIKQRIERMETELSGLKSDLDVYAVEAEPEVTEQPKTYSTSEAIHMLKDSDRKMFYGLKIANVHRHAQIQGWMDLNEVPTEKGIRDNIYVRKAKYSHLTENGVQQLKSIVGNMYQARRVKTNN